MTKENRKRFFYNLRAQGYTDERILQTLYLAYQEDKIDLLELEKSMDALGYEFTAKYNEMSIDEKKAKKFEEISKEIKRKGLCFLEYSGKRWKDIPEEVRKQMEPISEKVMKSWNYEPDFVWDGFSQSWVLRYVD